MSNANPLDRDDLSAPAAAGIGHNRPPRDPLNLETIAEEIDEVLADLVKEVDDLVDDADAAIVTSPARAEKAVNVAKKLRTLIDEIEERRKTYKRPHLEAAAAVQARFIDFATPLGDARETIMKRLNLFKAKTDEAARQVRLAAEQEAKAKADEAARLEREAEAARVAAAAVADKAARAVAVAEAAAKATEAAKLTKQSHAASAVAEAAAAPLTVVSEYGAKMHSKAVGKYKIEDYRKLPDSVLQHKGVHSAIDKVVAQMVKAGVRDLKGVKIWEDSEGVVR